MLSRRRHNRLRDGSAPRWQLPPLPWRKLGAIGATVLGIAGACAALLVFLNQPIEHIRVDGQFQHLSALEVEKAVRAQLHGAGLVTVRLNDVRRSLRLLPWVESATVQRSWPRGIAVQRMLRADRHAIHSKTRAKPYERMCMHEFGRY